MRFKEEYGYSANDYYTSLLASGLDKSAQMIMEKGLEIENEVKEDFYVAGNGMKVVGELQDEALIRMIEAGKLPEPDEYYMEQAHKKRIAARKALMKEMKVVK